MTAYDAVFIGLEMKGQVDYDLRMEGTMVPRGGGVTFTGSWDFFAKKTLAFAASNLG